MRTAILLLIAIALIASAAAIARYDPTCKEFGPQGALPWVPPACISR